MRFLKNLLALTIGILILAYILWSLNPERVLELFLSIRVEYFLLAALIYLILEFVNSFILRLLLNSKLSLRDVLPAHMCGMLYANATPGRLGYYYTALSLARKGKTPKATQIGLLTLFQGMNFLLKVGLCLLAIVYFSTFIVGMESWLYLLLVALFPLILVIIGLIAFYTDSLNALAGRLSPRLRKSLERMQNSCRNIGKKTLFKVAGLMLLGWVLMSLQWFLIICSLGIEIKFLTVLMLQPLLTTVMFIPISPSGLGIAEGGSALIFGLLAMDPAAGVAFLLLARFNSILIDSMGLVDMKTHLS